MEERVRDINIKLEKAEVVPIGSIVWMMRDVTKSPDGYFLCDGQTLTFTKENGIMVYTKTIVDTTTNTTTYDKHVCKEFWEVAAGVTKNESNCTITLPDLRGKTCIGPKSYSANFALALGDSFSGMIPPSGSENSSKQWLPNDSGTSVSTKYKHVFSGAWGYYGDGFAWGAFKKVHKYDKSSGSSSHGGSGVYAIALDLSEMVAVTQNGGTVPSGTVKANKTDILPASIIVNPFIKVY